MRREGTQTNQDSCIPDRSQAPARKCRLTNVPGCGSMRLRHAKMGTHYDSLKVTEDAPQEVIRAAYRVLSLKYHPDTSSGSPQALRMMQTLNEAYAILSDAGKRADYDGELHRLRRPATIPNRRPGLRGMMCASVLRGLCG